MYAQEELIHTSNHNNAEWVPEIGCSISFEALIARTADLLNRLDREASLLNNRNVREQHAVSDSQE
jgi:hypothetical protein